MPGWGHADPQSKPGDVMPIVLVPGMEDMLPHMRGQGATSATSPGGVIGSNTVFYLPFVVHRTATVKRIAWLNGGTVVGTTEVGIYNEAGARLVTSGAITNSGTNAQQVADIADTELTPGLYYAALVSTGGSSCYFHLVMGVLRNISFTSLDTASSYRYESVYTQSSATLPSQATFGFVSIVGRIPFISLYRSAA